MAVVCVDDDDDVLLKAIVFVVSVDVVVLMYALMC